jgi:AcrR family transcriptional regulator
MPRPRRVEDVAVLDATAELMVRDGLSGVTFGRVGGEVGLSPAAVVQRFGSKRALLLAVAERWAEMELPPGSVPDALVALASSVATPEAMANGLAALQLDLSDPEFHALTRRGFVRMREQIAERLAADGRPADLAQAVQTAYNGALITWAIYREGSLERWLRAQLDAVLPR